MISRDDLIENVFKKYEDPELGIDVWTLGLIYDLSIEGENVKVLLTFTSPMCPFGPQMVDDLTQMIKEQGAKNVELEVTFHPPWKPPEGLRDMLGI